MNTFATSVSSIATWWPIGYVVLDVEAGFLQDVPGAAGVVDGDYFVLAAGRCGVKPSVDGDGRDSRPIPPNRERNLPREAYCHGERSPHARFLEATRTPRPQIVQVRENPVM